MPKYRRKRRSLRKAFMMPGALFEALRLEAKHRNIESRSQLLFFVLAECFRKSSCEEVCKLVEEYDNEEATIAAEEDERAAREEAIKRRREAAIAALASGAEN